MTILKTRVESFRIDKLCDRCKKGKMVGTGHGVTQLHTVWEHRCDNNNCKFIDWYSTSYPSIEYYEVGKPKRVKEL